jgi:hypothetical protein
MFPTTLTAPDSPILDFQRSRSINSQPDHHHNLHSSDRSTQLEKATTDARNGRDSQGAKSDLHGSGPERLSHSAMSYQIPYKLG